MTNYLVLQVGGEALGQQPITRKTNSKAKNTTKQPRMKQNLRWQQLRKRTMNIGTWNVQGIFKSDQIMIKIGCTVNPYTCKTLTSPQKVIMIIKLWPILSFLPSWPTVQSYRPHLERTDPIWRHDWSRSLHQWSPGWGFPQLQGKSQEICA